MTISDPITKNFWKIIYQLEARWLVSTASIKNIYINTARVDQVDSKCRHCLLKPFSLSDITQFTKLRGNQLCLLKIIS